MHSSTPTIAAVFLFACAPQPTPSDTASALDTAASRPFDEVVIQDDTDAPDTDTDTRDTDIEPIEPPSGTLGVLTYNVHGLPSILTLDDTTGRMEQIAPLLPGFELIGLQEDFLEENHDILVDGAMHLNNLWFDDKVDDTRVYGSGVATLTSLVITQTAEEHFETCSGIITGANDCLASKGFQMVRVEMHEGVTIDVYTTHLDAGNGDDDQAARESQAEQLFLAMDAWSPDNAIVFMGDTNLDPEDSEAEAALLERFTVEMGFIDACERVGCAETRIDRIMVRSGTQVLLDVLEWTNEAFEDSNGTPLSDHDPLSATIAWAAAD